MRTFSVSHFGLLRIHRRLFSSILPNTVKYSHTARQDWALAQVGQECEWKGLFNVLICRWGTAVARVGEELWATLDWRSCGHKHMAVIPMKIFFWSCFDHVVPLRTASINQRRQLKTLFCERSGKNKTVIYWDVGKKQLSLKEWMSQCGVSNKKSQLLMCCGVFIFPVYICWSINASSKQNSSLQMGIEPLKTMVILIVNKGSLNGQNSWCEWITITDVRNVLKQLHIVLSCGRPKLNSKRRAGYDCFPPPTVWLF